MSAADSAPSAAAERLRIGEWSVGGILGAAALGYVLLLVALLAADIAYATTPHGEDALAGNPFAEALADANIRYAIRLSLISCSIATLLSLLVAVPIAYFLSRAEFPGKVLLDTLLDVPVVLPPLVVGLSLLILFQYLPRSLHDAVVYQAPAVIMAQFVVSAALAIRTLRAAFDQIDPRLEQVARTLGATRLQAFGWVTLPAARPAMVTAATLAWARSLGEFGPVLVFAGATRGKTEVLSTTVFLELSLGNLRGAVAVSLLMIVAAVVLLTLARLAGQRGAKLR